MKSARKRGDASPQRSGFLVVMPPESVISTDSEGSRRAGDSGGVERSRGCLRHHALAQPQGVTKLSPTLSVVLPPARHHPESPKPLPRGGRGEVGEGPAPLPSRVSLEFLILERALT